MNILTARLILRRETVEVPAGQSVEDALRSLGLHPETYLALRDGALIPLDTILRAGDEVRLIPTISGG